MKKDIISIIGIDNAMKKRLNDQKFNNESITTMERYIEATRTADDREILSKKTGIPLHDITYWATQAELFRIDGMDAEEAFELIDAGIYSVKQLQTAKKNDILDAIYKNNEGRNAKIKLTEQKLSNYQKAKVVKASDFEYEDVDSLLNSDKNNSKDNSVLGMYADLSDVISDLGKGIAEAQHELDMHSIDVQNEIFADEKLTMYGLNATWYVMPEVEFTLKMDYSVTNQKEKKEEYKTDGKILKSKLPGTSRSIRIMPVNATTQNLYKSETTQQSTLKLRFVPVPPAEKYTIRRIIPNCSGKTLAEAKELLQNSNIATYRIVDSDDTIQLTPNDKQIIKKQILEISGKAPQEAKVGEFLPIGGIINLVI